MKNLQSILFATLFTLLATVSSFGQTYESFIKYEGVETLASLAHPTNTYRSGSYKLYKNAVDVTINYEGGITTKLRVFVEDGWVSSIEVMYDNDWWPPFAGTQVLKDIVFELVKEDLDLSNEILPVFEQFLGRPIQKLSGSEVSMVVLTLAYFNY